jgi:hypothetical protein
MSRANRLSWTIARYAKDIPGGTLFAASSCASAGVRLAQELFGSTLYQCGRGGPYDIRGLLSIHARHWLFNHRPRAHADLPGVFDTLSEPHALMATPAQVDGVCNANLSVVGDHARPKVSFGGTRGLPDARAIHFVLPAHSPRQLVAKVDFVSTAAAHRDEPPMLFTELCMMRWSKAANRWRLDSIAPEVSLDEVRARTGFAFDVAEKPALLEDPPPDVVRLLDEIDPLGVRDLDFIAGRKDLLDAYERIYAAEARMVGAHAVPPHRLAAESDRRG